MSGENNAPADEEDRIRAVFGLPDQAPLPKVNKETLRRYHDYLLGRLSFPFPALYAETAPPVRQIMRYVSVIGLSESRTRRHYGLFCRVQLDDKVVELPLSEMAVKEDAPNRQLIDDYLYWLWNGH